MEKKNPDIESKIFKVNKEVKIFYAKYIPQNISKFKNKKVIAFAGIGNPENFFDLLKNNNVNVLEEINFPDHYNYSHEEMKNLIDNSKIKDAILLTTEKDFFRIDVSYRKKIEHLKIKIEIENKKLFIKEIKKVI